MSKRKRSGEVDVIAVKRFKAGTRREARAAGMPMAVVNSLIGAAPGGTRPYYGPLMRDGRYQSGNGTFVSRGAGNVAAITENKYFDTYFKPDEIENVEDAGNWDDSVRVVQRSGATVGIFTPITGSSYFTREGRVAFVKKIMIRGFINVPNANGIVDPTAANVNGLMARMLLVQDKQTNGNQVQGSAILSTAVGGVGGGNVINYFQNIDNFGRFQVLKDKTITFNDPNYTSPEADGVTIWSRNGMVRPVKLVHKFKTPMRVQFKTTDDGNITDVLDNSFHLLIGTNAPWDGDQGAPKFFGMSRVVFTESV